MATKSATACVMAAIDLTHVVYETYHTNATDAWWYNGFCMRSYFSLIHLFYINSNLDVSTAAIVLLMSFSAPSMLRPSAMDKAREAWREATSVLESMATVSLSASNTLRFLRAAYRQAVPGYGDAQQTEVGDGVANSNSASFQPHLHDMAHTHDPFDHPDHDLLQVPFFNWEEYAANVGQGEGQGLDDLGFLTRLDFPDTLS